MSISQYSASALVAYAEQLLRGAGLEDRHAAVVASVLVGATRPEQVAANAAAAEVTFSADDLQAISEAATPS